jgi:hypothetical protein
VFVAYKNIVCTLKWPSLKAKIEKTKKSKFGRIDSRTINRRGKKYGKLPSIFTLKYFVITEN